MEQTKKQFVKSIQEKYAPTLGVMPEWATPLDGLEGPFMYRGGRVLYYDTTEGRYYDRRTDMYLSSDEMDALI